MLVRLPMPSAPAAAANASALGGGQVIGAVDHDEIRLAEPGGEPVGRDEPAAGPDVVVCCAGAHVQNLDLTIRRASGWIRPARGGDPSLAHHSSSEAER